jgi:hypothetical protein
MQTWRVVYRLGIAKQFHASQYRPLGDSIGLRVNPRVVRLPGRASTFIYTERDLT